MFRGKAFIGALFITLMVISFYPSKSMGESIGIDGARVYILDEDDRIAKWEPPDGGKWLKLSSTQLRWASTSGLFRAEIDGLALIDDTCSTRTPASIYVGTHDAPVLTLVEMSTIQSVTVCLDQAGNVTDLRVSATTPPYPAGSYHLALREDVIEHVERPTPVPASYPLSILIIAMAGMFVIWRKFRAFHVDKHR